MEIKDLLQKIIQIPSLSGQEKELQEWIFEYLKSLHHKPQWVGPNVVVKIAGKDSSKALIFNGHVDTVLPGDEKAWKYGPFSGTIAKGKLYGLGASDMKSGDALMLALAEKYSKEKPPVDVWLHFVVKEETDGSGTGEVMDWFAKNHQKKYKKIAGIIGESTGNQEIKIAHKGNIFLKITTRGESGHGSQPHKVKIHAVSHMYAVAQQLEKLVKGWAKYHTHELLGSPSIALFTSFAAGSMESPNKIPDTCVATFDIRTTPSIHYKAIGIIKKLLAGEHVLIDVAYDPLPYGHTKKEAYIVQIAQKVTKLPVGFSQSSNDLLFFTTHNISAIVLGPGTIHTGHSANEYVEVKNLKQCLKFYTKIIEAF